jgi:Tfp pilus assembly protein PilW
MIRALRGSRTERGMTLAELLVGTAITMIVTTLMVAGIFVINRSSRYNTEDSDTLAALRTASTRFSRELRQARRVYSISDGKRIRFWVDLNRDYLQDIGERVSWELQPVDGKAQFVRYTDSPTSTAQIQVRNLVYADVFVYQTDDGTPDTATLVELNLVADSINPGIAAERLVRTEIRLRNSDPTAPSYGSGESGAGHWSDEEDTEGE